MQTFQTMDKKAYSTDEEISKIIGKLIDGGFPKIAAKLSCMYGKRRSDPKDDAVSIRSLSWFCDFLSKTKSKILTDGDIYSIDLTADDGFVNARWMVPSTIVAIEFHGSGTVEFSILTDDRSKPGAASRISGTIQNVVLIKSIDSLIAATAHVENHD